MHCPGLSPSIAIPDNHDFFCVGVMYSGEYDACDVTLQSNITSIIPDKL